VSSALVEREEHWRRRWLEDPPFSFAVDSVPAGEKFYNLVEFPYPSAEGLHVGHVYTYCGADTLGRYRRMRGRKVFQPMGFDSFGIHTENYALRVGENPKTLTARTIANYRRQLRRLGAAWEWEHELTTSDPDYYRWTQWIFVKLFEAGLAEQQESSVVWCPSCLTVLAFEQVDGDSCERCGTVVTQKVMKQWYLRITAYADALVDSLDGLDWPDLSKVLQREWIGRSDGAEVVFDVAGRDGLAIETFTTRVDTLYGVTYIALSSSHPFVAELTDEAHAREVATFVEAARSVVGAARFSRQGELPARGVFTGAHATHPLTGAPLPIYVADYVLEEYGTGAVMGVPAHDARDLQFAEAMGLPVRTVVAPPAGSEGSKEDDLPPLTPRQIRRGGEDAGVWTGDGVLVDSGPYSGLPSAAARDEITDGLSRSGRGRASRRYRLRDWLVSRQRYWGSPIPIVHCEECGPVAVPVEDLPVVLPDVEQFRPTGTGLSPLATIESFVNASCPRCGGPARRETDVLDTFVESSWYYLRYPQPHRDDVPWDPEVMARLLPVDMYAGGREHTTRHHLYARFVTRALHDLGLLPFAEPFATLRLHGMLIKDGAKMSKSRGNVVNPDEYVDRVGADNLRLYLLFCGPWEEGGDFSDRGLMGMVRFTARLAHVVREAHAPGPGGVDLAPLHHAIARVQGDIERLKFNTAIAALMECVRWLRGAREQMNEREWQVSSRTLVRLLAPLAPHLAEELWSALGEPYSVHCQPWPQPDESALRRQEYELVIQVNGRVRDRVAVPCGTTEQEAIDMALNRPRVASHLQDRSIRRVVFVPDRLLNLVA
jgi:leucyl-tRNA synthetase